MFDFFILNLGAKRVNGELHFLFKFFDVKNAEEVPASIANKYWSHTVIRFYENNLDWIAPSIRFSDVPSATTESNVDESIDPESVQCN